MRQVANAIGDSAIERVTVLKSSRIGFSTVLTAAIGYHVVAILARCWCCCRRKPTPATTL
jgi:phage terminase large subunit GpA-like protein